MTVRQWKNALLNNGKYMTFGALGGFLRTPKNPPGYGPEVYADFKGQSGYAPLPQHAESRHCPKYY